ncbi:MAG: ribosome recycling factor, partial [Actinobacteria bacterium]|nr:ribosome recycling factor [Actinomycetota bacterium]
AGISVPENNLLVIQPWDKTAIPAIEKALNNAQLGMTPAVDGGVIRLRVPAMTEDRRKDLVKQMGKRAEEARVEIRNVRRDEQEAVKKAEKAKEKARIAAEKAAIREAKEKERIAIREAKEAARLAAAEAKKAEEARLEAIRKKNEPKPKATHEKTEFLDGIYATKDFDHKFLASQRELLLEMRAVRTTQAARLEDEANALIEDVEMGDVQFDEEGGEGDTMVVERERDLVLSAEARHEIQEIDAALERIRVGDYGYSIHSGLPIPRERLKAIPWTQESVQERVGGLGRR